MTPTVQPTMTYQCPHCRATLEATAHCGPNEATTCPACHQAFELDLPDAREDGRSILLPPGVEAPPPAPPAAAPAPQAVPAAQPVAQPVAVQPVAAAPAETPETLAEVIRVSMPRRYPVRCLAYFVGIVASVAAAVWCLNSGYHLLAAVPGGILLYLLAQFGVWWLRMRNTSLTITDRRVVVETGVFTRHATEVARTDVSDVLVAQDPLMRLLDVGDLIIRSDKGAQKEIVLMAVPHPDLVVPKITAPPTPPQGQAGAAQSVGAA